MIPEKDGRRDFARRRFEREPGSGQVHIGAETGNVPLRVILG